jgi:hypothetical protein
MKTKSLLPAAVWLTLVMSLIVTWAAAADSGYHVVKTYTLGGEGGWDYLTLDSASRRLYISRATHVVVIDADSGKPVGDIPDTPGVHGIALAPDCLRRAYRTCRRPQESAPVLRVQRQTDGADTGQLITTLPIGDGVDGTAFDPDTGYAFASCGEGLLTVVHEDSAGKFSVVDNIPTQRGARTLTLDPKTHQLFLVTAKFGPPPATTASQPRPRPAILPDSFVMLVVGR